MAKHDIARRTLLRGLGVSMALPWMESRPVWGDEPGAGQSGSNAPTVGSLLVLGLPSQPMSAPGLVAPGCALRLDLRLPIVIVPHTGGRSWSMQLPVTSNGSLLGTQIAIQGAYAPTPVRVSNGVKLTVGR